MALRYTATPDAPAAPAQQGVSTYPWAALVPRGTPVLASPHALDQALASTGWALLLGGRRGDRSRLRAAADAAGANVEREFVVLPSLSSPYLAVDDVSGPVRWLRDSVLTVPAGTTYFAPAVSSALWLLRKVPWTLVGRLAGGRAVLVRRAQPGVTQQAASAPRQIAEPVPVEDLTQVAGTRLGVLAMSRDVNAKVSVAVFDTDGDSPVTVVKIATTPVAAEAVRAEAAILEALRDGNLGAVRGTVPRYLGVHDASGLPALAATALGGQPMRTAYHRWGHTASRAGVRSDFAMAGRWLEQLQRATATAPAPMRLLEGNLDRLVRRWPADPDVERIEAALRPLAGRLAEHEVPQTVVHGDFWHGNVLVGRGGVTGVVDWEYGRLAGDPTRDVACFPLGYALYLDRHTPPGWPVLGHPGMRAQEWGVGVERAVLRQGWFGEVVHEFVSVALLRLGAPPALARAVLLGGMVQFAVDADRDDHARLHVGLVRRVVDRLPEVTP